MANNAEAKILYLKTKLAWKIENIQIIPELDYFRVRFSGDYERTEVFSGISRETLTDLLKAHFPQAFNLPDGGGDYLIIRQNGEPMTTARDMNEADEILRIAAEQVYESIFSVVDLNGRILARYVSNLDGTVKRLEDVS